MANKQYDVLLIDDDAKRSQTLLSIFQFLNKSCIRTSSTRWQHHADKLQQLTVVFITVASDINQTQDIVNAIYTQLPTLSLILLCDDNCVAKKALSIRQSNIINRLVLPLEHTQLTDALHQCSVVQDREHDHNASVNRDDCLFRSLAGDSDIIATVKKLMQQVYDQDVTVLILGESGTGKEVVARSLHYQSQRRDNAFIPVNCGAIPPDLLESELFGHEKGAFTGAVGVRKGRFELAQGGTLFLDEIGDMPLNMQVKLLRVLQERCFERVGGNKTIPIDVRIIAATHRNLEKLIEENTFREDLYYRLNVFPIDMPALRQRAQDIPVLISEITNRLQEDGRNEITLSKETINTLCQYPWPGNVRELANLIERLTILYPNELIKPEQLPEKFREAQVHDSGSQNAVAFLQPQNTDIKLNGVTELTDAGIDLKSHIQAIEIALIRQALRRAHGVVSKASELLALRRTTLVEKMRKYNLQQSNLNQVESDS